MTANPPSQTSALAYRSFHLAESRRDVGDRIRRASGLIFDVALLPGLALALAGYFGRFAWLLDMTNFFRPHIGFFCLLVLALGIVSGSRRRGLMGLIVMVIAAFPLFISTVPTAARADGGNFRMITANVFSENTDTRSFPDLVARVDPDLVVTEEAADQWQPVLKVMPTLPFVVGPGEGSILVASRYPMTMETLPVFAPGSQVRVKDGDIALRIQVTRPGTSRPLILYAIHPATPRTAGGWRLRNAYLAVVSKRLASDIGSADIIVAGDWNTPFWSPFFADLVNGAGLAAAEAGAWPSPTRIFAELGALPFLGTPIDLVAVSPEVRIAAVKIGPDVNSDHLPVLVDMKLQ